MFDESQKDPLHDGKRAKLEAYLAAQRAQDALHSGLPFTKSLLWATSLLLILYYQMVQMKEANRYDAFPDLKSASMAFAAINIVLTAPQFFSLSLQTHFMFAFYACIGNCIIGLIFESYKMGYVAEESAFSSLHKNVLRSGPILIVLPFLNLLLFARRKD